MTMFVRQLYWSSFVVAALISSSSDLWLGTPGVFCRAMELSRIERTDESVFHPRVKRVDESMILSREKRTDVASHQLSREKRVDDNLVFREKRSNKDGKYLSRQKRKNTTESNQSPPSEMLASNVVNNASISTTVASPYNTTEAGGFMKTIQDNSGMLLRAMYVLLGVTGIVVVYFVIRAVSLRRRRANPRKYGVLAQNDRGGLEMEPLGDGYDEDDDDYTVFEANKQKRSQR